MIPEKQYVQDYVPKRYEKLLYIGALTDPLPLPIARNAVYVDICKINMVALINTAKQMYKLSQEPTIVYSNVEYREVAEILFEWGDNPPLTRYVQGVCLNESILSYMLKSSIFITFAQNMVHLAKNTYPFVILNKKCPFVVKNMEF